MNETNAAAGCIFSITFSLQHPAKVALPIFFVENQNETCELFPKVVLNFWPWVYVSSEEYTCVDEDIPSNVGHRPIQKPDSILILHSKII